MGRSGFQIKEGYITMEVYLVKFLFQGTEKYTLWYTEDSDGFLKNQDEDTIAVFSSRDAAAVFASRQGNYLDGNTTVINCDAVLCCLTDCIMCSEVLNFWNIVSDIAATLGILFSGDDNGEQIAKLYDKLFYGCNLPSYVGDRPAYVPVWSEEERKRLTEIVKEGLEIVKRAVCK